MQPFPLALLVASVAALAFSLHAEAGPGTVDYPAGYQASYVNYLDVDRPDRKRVRKMYVSPEAHAAAKPGAALPEGTILIMEDHDAQLDADGNPVTDTNGRMIALEPVVWSFIMEKNPAATT